MLVQRLANTSNTKMYLLTKQNRGVYRGTYIWLLEVREVVYQLNKTVLNPQMPIY